MDNQLPSREPYLHQAQVYRIPDTLTNWPWPARIAPYIDKVNADLNAFIKGYPQLEGEALKVLEKSETAFFVCCVYPTLNEAQLGVAAPFVIIGWLVDKTDELNGAHGIRAVSNIIMDALRYPSKTRPVGEHILGEISRQWWLRTIKEMTPICAQRLFNFIEEWLLSCVHQAQVSHSSDMETIEGCTERRSIDVGMLVCMMFVEMEADIPQHVWENPALETARSLLCHIVFLDNDMFSYNKEQAEGDNHNILCIVMREQQLSLEDAFEWVNKRHRDLQEKYLQCLAKMPSWGPEIDAQVDKCIGGWGRMISGNVKYSISCKRYADRRERIGPQDNRVFELLPSRPNAIPGTVKQ